MNQSTIVGTVIRGLRLSFAAALLALLAGLLAITQPARAATYEVTNSNNSGPGSLRQAINDANNNPGPDTITFAAATDGNPIVLAGAANENGNASGDLDILDGGDLTIQGNGAANTLIDGGGIDRVFHVCPGGGCANMVTFAGVTIRNGTITTYGGGIYNESGGTTVDGSTVSANTATYGGGIYSKATLTVQNSSTIGGIGAGNQAGSGGGISINDGTTTVNGSTISANTATNSGGGIDNGFTLVIQNGSTIGGVGAGNTAGSGGGIYNENGGRTTVNDSTVSANTADRGGGIFNVTGGTTTVDGSRILNNKATTGGGVYNFRDDAVATSVTGSCIVGNSATSYFNNRPAQQIATGNWWGASTGPNTPGADTVSGNVDVSGYLTTPILGCVPDLQVSKANDTDGSGTIGIPFHWTLTVSNTGLTGATFGATQTILQDDLPAGPTYDAPLAGSFVGVANSGNIKCGLAGNTLTCAAAGGNVNLEAGTGSFEVTFSVRPSTPLTLVNPAGICQVDPDGHVTEGDESNNDCPDNVVIVRDLPYHLYLPFVSRWY